MTSYIVDAIDIAISESAFCGVVATVRDVVSVI